MINITNKRARQLYVAEMARLMRRLETTNIRELKPILNRQYMNCARLVQQGVLDGAYHAVDMERDRLATKVALHYRRTATVFGKKAYKIIDSSKGIAFPEEVKAPLDEFWAELNRWIPSQTAMKVTKIQNTSKKLLASVIQKGMQEGESHRQIASRIRSTGRISTLQRAKTIAITETHTAAVHSVDTAIKSTRIEMEKEWSASLDKRTRPDHVVADGQRVPENGVFIVGGMPMKYPGDPAGGPAQTVLCRCVLLYHTVKRMDELKPYVSPGSIPAETIKEAEIQARMMGVKKAKYSDLTSANECNKFLASQSILPKEIYCGVDEMSKAIKLPAEDLYRRGIRGYFDAKKEAIYVTPSEGYTAAKKGWFWDKKEKIQSITNVLTHETGHLIHLRTNPVLFNNLWGSLWKYADDDLIDEITKQVGKYAATDTLEFVAEVTAAKANGIHFSGPIEKLYNKFLTVTNERELRI